MIPTVLGPQYNATHDPELTRSEKCDKLPWLPGRRNTYYYLLGRPEACPRVSW